jgi:hypothetical protein
MRLIDADDLLAKVQENAPGFMDSRSTITKAFIMAMINTKSVAPTIDAVPVVRCKDCLYGADFDIDVDPYVAYQCAKGYGSHTGDWFCADGGK